MDITVRVEVQYVAPEHARIRDVLQMFRTPAWVRFMVRYISPHLKNAAPADKSVMENLAAWQITAATAVEATGKLAPCVICMSDLQAQEEANAVQLPCGHCFHQECIHSWLKLKSTCPTCRFQFRKAFSGSYAVRTLNSALLLKQEHRNLLKEDILNAHVGKETVRAVVNVTLNQIATQTKQSQYPCILNALMIHSNGESFTDVQTVRKADMENTESAPAATIGHIRRAEEVDAPASPSSIDSTHAQAAMSEASSPGTKRLRVN